MRLKVLTIIAALAALTGCAPTLTGVRVYYPADAPAASGDHVQMNYLGNGGWLIRRGADVIATAPFVSNPVNVAVYTPAESDRARLDALPPMRDVKSILLGHAHYDHAMDLPYIMKNKVAPDAKLYGGKTVRHLFRKTLGENRVEDVSDRAYVPGGKPGRWVDLPEAPVRFMPLSSSHAPHVLGFIKVVSGARLDADVEAGALPAVPAAWPEGEPLAFLIDFLTPDRSKVVFRLYYQDSAAPPGQGTMPSPPPDGVPVDVAILCVAGFSQVDRNPEHILDNVKPGYIVGGHWENFFTRSRDLPPKVAPGTSLEEFVRRAHEAARKPVYVAEPDRKIFIPIAPR